MNWGDKYGGYKHAQLDDAISWISIVASFCVAILIGFWSFT
ncbi:MAG: hypothetical protein QF513_00225 [Gammaproteobacteria bacterium]|jgi:hypothetical protein|nr:hypothetical protein [Gammaproteobacteria bacterium]HJL80836.1 hypothetical protein [Gammaproteobacteria bacterium]HJM08627.1 hypothetical protein [Gammaproteobacteria bacterium]HJN01012.1 hypothetical protein [Gammaproteobacteria bacterium]